MKKLERTLKRAGERQQVINAQIFFAGVLSVFTSERLHRFVSGTMVIFTTLSLVAITESKIYKIDFPYGFVLPLLLVCVLIYSYFFSDFLEEGKIALTRSLIYANGWFQGLSLLGTISVISFLIMINYFGVLAASDFSNRYLNKKLLESSEVVQAQSNLNMLKSSIVQNSFNDYDKQITTLQRSRAGEHNKRSLAVIDWKISQLLKQKRAAINEQNTFNNSIIKQSISTTKSLQDFIQNGKIKNAETVKSETSWALIFAVAGEILDGFFIFLFLLLHKTNPSLDNLATLKKGERKGEPEEKEVKKLESNFIQKSISTPNSLGAFSEKKKSNKSSGKVSLSHEKFIMIKEVADKNREDESHISRRNLAAIFKRTGESVTPSQMTLYFKKREEQGEIYRPTANGKYKYQKELETV